MKSWFGNFWEASPSRLPSTLTFRLCLLNTYFVPGLSHIQVGKEVLLLVETSNVTSPERPSLSKCQKPHSHPHHCTPTHTPQSHKQAFFFLLQLSFSHSTYYATCLLYEHLFFLSLQAVEYRLYKGTTVSPGPATMPGTEKPSANIY